jgi:serine protease Do
VERATEAVNPALVRISVVEVDYSSGREMKSEATGSGVILTKEGHVITNHHVAGNAKQIFCTLGDKEDIDADLVGTDPLTDICVIKLRPDKSREFRAARFGDSSRLKVGDPVLAMGSPLALSQSVTMGIVSNTQLVMPDLFWPFRFEIEGEDVGTIVRWIGHDASISPGNSGGPLVNLKGEVVGINEMRFGLSAAIPGNLAREVAEQLIGYGKVKRSWSGVEVQPLLKSSAQREGVLVSGTIPGSPAEKAGFQSGDILISLAGQKVSVSTAEELPIFNQVAVSLPVGQETEATVIRKGEKLALRVAPEEWKSRQPRARELAEWGMTARNLSPLMAKEMRRDSPDGVLVTSVRPGGACDGAEPSIVQDDVIIEVAGKRVNSVEELVAATKQVTEGKSEPVPVVVSFDREAARYLTVVKVGIRPLPEPGQETSKAWLGVATQVLTRDIAEALDLGERTGVRVTQVYPNSSAETAGLKVGDFILALDGEPIPASRPEHFEVFPAMVRQFKIGSKVELTVVRDKEERKIQVELEQSPKLAGEVKKYRDNNFEFTVRDLVFTDRARQRWKEQEGGTLVDTVGEGGWAALGHLAVDDMVIEVDGQPTPDVGSLEERMKGIAAARPKAVVFRVRRGIHHLFIELKPKWPGAG